MTSPLPIPKETILYFAKSMCKTVSILACPPHSLPVSFHLMPCEHENCYVSYVGDVLATKTMFAYAPWLVWC